MPKQRPKHEEHSDNADGRRIFLFDRLLKALTQQELVQLMDVLFTVLSHKLQEQAIAQQNFIPKPESASKSDYTHHAQWMLALKELFPQKLGNAFESVAH